MTFGRGIADTPTDPAQAGPFQVRCHPWRCVRPCRVFGYGVPPEPLPAVELVAGVPLEVVDGGMPPAGVIAVAPDAGAIVLEVAGGVIGCVGSEGVVGLVVGVVAEVAVPPLSAFSLSPL
jgi:hypothetical protein